MNSDTQPAQFRPCDECATPDICSRGAACGFKVQARASAIEKLAAFGAAVLRSSRVPETFGCEDEATLQELGVEAGVLTLERCVTEPCSEDCQCSRLLALPRDCYSIPDDVFAIVEKA